MRFMRILSELYCKPCVIEPAMHKKICDIVDAHISGQMENLAFMDGTVQDEVKLEIMEDIAIIPIQGVIAKHVSGIQKSSGMADVDDIEAMVIEAVEDSAVNGILFDVNSPGGGITGVPELARLISQATDVMPTLAYTDELMASAAMWLSAGCGAIYASQTAKVGSIGVYMAFLDQSRAMEMQGLKVELIKAGRLKGMGMPGTELTDEMRDMLQEEVDKVYGWFTSHVQAHRYVGFDSMQGQAFFGEDAVGRGLVDRIGSRADAVRELKDMIRLGK